MPTLSHVAGVPRMYVRMYVCTVCTTNRGSSLSSLCMRWCCLSVGALLSFLLNFVQHAAVLVLAMVGPFLLFLVQSYGLLKSVQLNVMSLWFEIG